MSEHSDDAASTTIVGAGQAPPTTLVGGGHTPPTTLVGAGVGGSGGAAALAATTVVGGTGVDSVTVVADGTTGLEHVPPEVFARYPGLNQRARAGNEAVVLTGDTPGLGPVAVKVYRPGLSADPAVVEVLQNRAERDHVVTFHDGLMVGGCWVEVLERIDGGSLADLAGGRPVQGDDLRDVVAELAAAIAHLHSLHLVHRDIKPANVLVRTESPLDLVLADFGLCAIHTDDVDLQAQSRTVAYASPETQMGLRSEAGDWWSLGMIVVELATGRHPFADLSNATILAHLIARDLDLDDVADDRVRLLCTGLLERDATTRWSEAEVSEWLAGGSPEVHRRSSTRVPYEFAGESFDSAASLLAAMSLDWPAAVSRVGGQLAFRQLCDWVVNASPGNGTVAVTLDAVSNESDAEVRLVRLLRQLSPGLPAVYRDWAVGDDGLGELVAAAVAAGPGSDELRAVASLWDNAALPWLRPDGTTVDAEWRTGWASVLSALGSHRSLHGAETDLARARMLLAVIDPDQARVLRDQAGAARSRQAGSVAWFRNIATRASSSVTAALAAVLLEETAASEARAEVTERKAARDEVVRSRRSETTRRYPRTRACLGWTLLVLGVVLVATIAARFVAVEAPGSYDGPVDPNGRVTAIDLFREGSWWQSTEVGQFFQPYALGLANPRWSLLLFVPGMVLWVRGRGVGRPDSTVTRSPWERGAMQAVIVGACCYLPVLAPFAVTGLYLGIYRAAEPELRNRHRTFRWILNAAGIGYLLHAFAVVVARSPQLSGWVFSYPSWFTDVRAELPPWVLATVEPTAPAGLLVPALVVAGVATLTIAARSLREQAPQERTIGMLLTPLGIFSLVVGVLTVAFYPVFGAGIAVAVVIGVVLALAIAFGVLAAFFNS